jgi:TRAP-type C4-dicarboxylate transport system permease small subunit
MSDQDKTFTDLVFDFLASLWHLVRYLLIIGLLGFIGVCGYMHIAKTQGEDVALGLLIILMYLSPFIVGGIVLALIINALIKYLRS